jgi:hypothetical protein
MAEGGSLSGTMNVVVVHAVIRSNCALVMGSSSLAGGGARARWCVSSAARGSRCASCWSAQTERIRIRVITAATTTALQRTGNNISRGAE